SISEAKAAAHYSTYGVLYNWAAATNACPAGWHLPGDEEWRTLTDNLDSQGVTAGGKMKETGTAHWLSPNTGATNESGFTAIPGGERTYSGSFKDIGDYSWFWSSSQLDASLVWIRVLLSTNGILHPDAYDRSDGFSVRCVKND
ncbi:MAG: fibrobacter succinogenes major paralogous domain-containing protein, partial [Bacteroidia bacterium]|nr:fibrobacter succinogenes major paralogous domain-containing protein [Bacteroidia bacterium]